MFCDITYSFPGWWTRQYISANLFLDESLLSKLMFGSISVISSSKGKENWNKPGADYEQFQDK